MSRVDVTRKAPWIRGLQMLILLICFAVAEAVLWLAALLQFGWILIGGSRNERIAEFGEDLSDWLARCTRFQTGATADKPFPWDKWGRG